MRPTGPFFATPVGRRATSAGGHFCETKAISDAADCLARRLSLCGLRPRAFAEAHSGATTVLVDFGFDDCRTRPEGRLFDTDDGQLCARFPASLRHARCYSIL